LVVIYGTNALDEVKRIDLVTYLGKNPLACLPLPGGVRFRSNRKPWEVTALYVSTSLHSQLTKPRWYEEIANAREELVRRGLSAMIKD
jgi:hypothetical protein